MRAAALVLGTVLMTSGCSPEFGPGAYFCGPERLCPPNLTCDENSFTCMRPSTVDPFACPDGAEVAEPDGTVGEAEDAGDLACGLGLATHAGCMAAGDGSDVIAFTVPSACTGSDPHMSLSLRFPIALVPLAVELLDAAGEPMATGVECTPPDNFTGKRHLCIEAPLEPGDYHLRITIDPEGADCGGDCRYNSYTLDVLYLLS